MLIHRSPAPVIQSSSTSGFCELDDDGRRFYQRMALDIGAVATAAGRPGHHACIVRLLANALVAAPAARTAAWAPLYHEIAAVTARARPATVPETQRAGLAEALTRLRAFLAENRDLANARERVPRAESFHDRITAR